MSRVQITSGPFEMIKNSRKFKRRRNSIEVIGKKDLEEEIKNLKKSNQLIIVEGDHDKEALQKLGLENIFVINKTGISLYNRIEEVVNRLGRKEKCVILTDFDKKGRKLYDLLKKEFVKQGIKINNDIRFILLKKRLSHIEGLANFYEHLKNEIYKKRNKDFRNR